MACLREQADQERIGDVQCSEEGCQFRQFAAGSRFLIDNEAPQVDCLLQLRLRAGDAEESWRREAGWMLAWFTAMFTHTYGRKPSEWELDIIKRYIVRGS